MDDLIPPQELARRVRAAIAYAGLDVAEIAQRTGIKAGTVRNIASDSRPSGGTPPRIAAIVAACDGVPASFMTVGFDPLRTPIDDTQRDLYVLRADVERRLAALESALTPAELVAAELRAAAQQRDEHPTASAPAVATEPSKGQVA